MNRLQIRLGGPYFAAFLVNRMTIDLQNRLNLSSPSRILASILQVRQAASPRTLQYRYLVFRTDHPIISVLASGLAGAVDTRILGVEVFLPVSLTRL